MADYVVTKGATSVILDIFVQDSSSTIGAGLTGLVFNSGSLTCYRARSDDGNAGGTSIALATATLGTWATGGFKEKDATNMPGWYEFGIPNNALASGSNFCALLFKGATNMVPLPVLIQLTTIDLQDAVRAGLTALPNANAEAAGGLFTRGSGAGQINQQANGQIDSNVARWLNTAVTAAQAGIPDVALKAILSTTLTETAGQIAAAFKQFFDVGTPTGTMKAITAVGTLTTYTGNTPQTGDAYARLGAPAGASHAADVAAVKVDTAAGKVQTDKLAFTVANQVDSNVIDWKGSAAPAMTGDAFARLGAPAGASVSADVAAVKTDTASLITTIGAAGAGLTAVALTSAYNFAKGTVAMTESYPSLHAAYTPAQALFMLVQKLYERSISSTTETIKGVDGSTAKMTETLNDATTPTAVTRAT